MNPTFKSSCLFDITAAPHMLTILLPQPWPHIVYLFSDAPKDERFPFCYVSFQIPYHAWGALSLPHFSIKGELFVYSTFWWMFYSIKHGFAVIDSEKQKEPPLSQNAIFLRLSFNFVLLWLPSHVFSCVGMTSESYVITSKHSLLA